MLGFLLLEVVQEHTQAGRSSTPNVRDLAKSQSVQESPAEGFAMPKHFDEKRAQSGRTNSNVEKPQELV